MTIWDTLTGRKSSQSSTTTTQHATSPSDNQHTSFDPSSAQGVDASLSPSTFADPSQLHPRRLEQRIRLSTSPSKIPLFQSFPEGQSVLPSRGFGDDLCSGTGTTCT